MRALLNPFVLLFAFLLVTISSYVGLRLATGPVEWGGIFVVAALLLLFPLVHWRPGVTAGSPRLRMFLQQLGFVSMGVMSWLLVIALARDLFLGASWLIAGAERMAAYSSATKGWPAMALAFSFLLFGVLRAYFGLVVRHVSVPVVNLPAGLQGLKIAQISDLHIGPTIGRAYVQRVVDRVLALGADLVVLTGDIVDGSVAGLRNDAAPLAALKGAYFAPGNHDYYSGFSEWKPELERLGFRVLINQGERVARGDSSFWIAGVTDPVAAEKPDPAAAARGGEKAGLRILLSHRPELAESAELAGFDLQLSGHTHGGQFFPWTHVAKRFHKFYLGLMTQGKMWIYVSPGTGSWGPPVRFGTTPEISLIELTGA